MTDLTVRQPVRHKREVLFDGSDALGDRLLQSLDAPPPSTPRLDAAAAALGAAAVILHDGLCARYMAEPAPGLAAEVGVAAFRIV